MHRQSSYVCQLDFVPLRNGTNLSKQDQHLSAPQSYGTHYMKENCGVVNSEPRCVRQALDTPNRLSFYFSFCTFISLNSIAVSKGTHTIVTQLKKYKRSIINLEGVLISNSLPPVLLGSALPFQICNLEDRTRNIYLSYQKRIY